MNRDLVNIRFFNGVNGVGKMSVIVNGAVLVDELVYGEYTQFFKAMPGIYSFEFVPDEEYSELSYIENVKFDEGTYTFATCGNFENMEFVVIGQDTEGSLPNIRFTNLIPFDSVVDIEINDDVVVPGLMYKEVSEVEKINEGDYIFKIFDTLTENKILEIDLQIASNAPHVGLIIGEMGSSQWPVRFILTND